MEKGSITVDGVSLTVAGTDGATFSVALIPTTLAHTTLGSRAVGDTVNLEVDVVAKYVERLTAGYAGPTERSEGADDWAWRVNGPASRRGADGGRSSGGGTRRRAPMAAPQGVDADTGFASVGRALADLAAGRPVVVVDDADRENEGDLIFAAEKATPELVSFMVRYTSGYICVALTEADCERLDLPPMHHTNLDSFRTAFTVTVDARPGSPPASRPRTGPGPSRCWPTRTAVAGDLVRPGHVLPLRAREGGVLRRPGHTEAAVDLARLAGLAPGRARCARSSRRRSRATWPAATSCGCSPRTTTWP